MALRSNDVHHAQLEEHEEKSEEAIGEEYTTTCALDLVAAQYHPRLDEAEKQHKEADR